MEFLKFVFKAFLLIFIIYLYSNFLILLLSRRWFDKDDSHENK
nr:MAG TPA: hypothetical protein [Inoviridae sp.]